jgi:hypothetical protein
MTWWLQRRRRIDLSATVSCRSPRAAWGRHETDVYAKPVTVTNGCGSGYEGATCTMVGSTNVVGLYVLGTANDRQGDQR